MFQLWTNANTTSVHLYPPGRLLRARLKHLNHRIVDRSAGLHSGAIDSDSVVRTPADGDDGEKTLVIGARWLEQPGAKRILAWYAVREPSLSDVAGCDSCCVKLRISTSSGKSSVDNVILWNISSGTSDHLAMFPMYAPRFLEEIDYVTGCPAYS